MVIGTGVLAPCRKRADNDPRRAAAIKHRDIPVDQSELHASVRAQPGIVDGRAALLLAGTRQHSSAPSAQPDSRQQAVVHASTWQDYAQYQPAMVRTSPRQPQTRPWKPISPTPWPPCPLTHHTSTAPTHASAGVPALPDGLARSQVRGIRDRANHQRCPPALSPLSSRDGASLRSQPGCWSRR